jgi:predicted nucleic acid-binding protein
MMTFMVPLTSPSTVFVDTSALLAVFDRSDQWHEKAEGYWTSSVVQSLPRPRILLTDFIIDEAATRIRSKVGHDKAVEAVRLLLGLVERGAFELLYINATRFKSAWEIFQEYPDQDFSFTDCTSFVVCQEEKVTVAFTFDADFKIYRINTVP